MAIPPVAKNWSSEDCLLGGRRNGKGDDEEDEDSISISKGIVSWRDSLGCCKATSPSTLDEALFTIADAVGTVRVFKARRKASVSCRVEAPS